MKRQIILLILLILSTQLIQAGSVGITPVRYKDFFEPGLTKSYDFYTFSSTTEEGVDLYIKGDLEEYAELSTTHLESSGDFTVTISLPNEIKKPGTHTILVGAMEARKIGEEGVGGIAAIQGRIDILVPYPGKYTESKFKIQNVNQGEKAQYELETSNFGTQVIDVSSKIEIFSLGATEPSLVERIPAREMKPKETVNIIRNLGTQSLPPGDYIAFATIDWGETTVLNQTFRIGEYLVDIVDYDYQFEQGKINPFNIEIENKWNTEINEVFAAVAITDEGAFVADFRTVSTNTKPWEKKNITGHFDTSNLEIKRYTAKIDISFGDEITSKLVAIYITKPPRETYRVYIIAAIIAITLIVAVFIYLIWKVRELSRKRKKNGKKK